MPQHIAHLALVVKDYDEAIEFYTQKLHFTLMEDIPFGESQRWVLVKPRGTSKTSLLLTKAINQEQLSRVGDQTGGRVFLILHTDNLDRDYQNLIDHEIPIVRPPTEEPYGKVLVFSDLYGNLWDLVQPSERLN